jgi:MinD-like ATPase involved in chromosome partitioning or flagellar assembly
VLRVALALDHRVEADVLTGMLEHGHRVAHRCIDAEELIRRLSERQDVDVVVVSASPALLTGQLIDAADATGLRLVAVAADETDRRHAASLGVVDVVTAPVEWADLERSLTQADPAVDARAPDSPRAAGRVTALWRAGGSPGCTTLAIGIAAELAATGARVVLCDADTYTSAVAPTLGLLDEAPGLAAACRLAGSGALDAEQLDRVAALHASPSGDFRVLTGIARAARWTELSAERVAETLAVCRTWADHVVVDTAFCIETDEEISSDFFAPRRNGAALAVLGAADRIVEVGTGDPVGLTRLLRGHSELVELVDPDHVSVVVNRVRSGAIGLDPAGQVASTLARFGGVSAAAMLPDDPRTADAAVLARRAVRDQSPRSALAAGIRRFVASTLLPQAGETESRRALRGRSARSVRSRRAGSRRRERPA